MSIKKILTILILALAISAPNAQKIHAVDVGAVLDLASVPVNDAKVRENVDALRKKEVGSDPAKQIEALQKGAKKVLGEIAKKLPKIPGFKLPGIKIGGIDIGDIAKGIGDIFGGIKKNVPSLDSITITLVRLSIDKIFDDMTDWVNSGFDGNPTFAVDLNDYLNKTGDAVLGQAISEITDGFACQPFRLEIEAAISRDFGKTNRKGNVFPNTCTLTDIKGNVQEFINGDFSQGGWPAWFKLTQIDENNPYGEYLVSVENISAKINGAKEIEVMRLNWSAGFIGTRKCKSYPLKPGVVTRDPKTGQTKISKPEYDKTKCLEWEETTPGQLLSNQVSKVFGASVDQLNIADEFDEFLGAVVNQLTNMVFSSGGLISSSGKKPITGTVDYGGGGGGTSSLGDCSVDKTNTTIGEEVNWSVDFSSSGDVVPTFTWSGNGVVAGTKTSEPTLKVIYDSAGDKSLSVVVNYSGPDTSQAFDPETQSYPTKDFTKTLSCAQIVKVSKYQPLVASCSPDKFVANKDSRKIISSTTGVIWSVYITGGSGQLDRIWLRGDEDDVATGSIYDDGMGRHVGVFLDSNSQIVKPFDRTTPVLFGADGDKKIYKFITAYETLGVKRVRAYIVDKDQTVVPITELACDNTVLVQ